MSSNHSHKDSGQSSSANQGTRGQMRRPLSPNLSSIHLSASGGGGATSNTSQPIPSAIPNDGSSVGGSNPRVSDSCSFQDARSNGPSFSRGGTRKVPSTFTKLDRSLPATGLMDQMGISPIEGEPPLAAGSASKSSRRLHPNLQKNLRSSRDVQNDVNADNFHQNVSSVPTSSSAHQNERPSGHDSNSRDSWNKNRRVNAQRLFTESTGLPSGNAESNGGGGFGNRVGPRSSTSIPSSAPLIEKSGGELNKGDSMKENRRVDAQQTILNSPGLSSIHPRSAAKSGNLSGNLPQPSVPTSSHADFSKGDIGFGDRNKPHRQTIHSDKNTSGVDPMLLKHIDMSSIEGRPPRAHTSSSEPSRRLRFQDLGDSHHEAPFRDATQQSARSGTQNTDSSKSKRMAEKEQSVEYRSMLREMHDQSRAFPSPKPGFYSFDDSARLPCLPPIDKYNQPQPEEIPQMNMLGRDQILSPPRFHPKPPTRNTPPTKGDKQLLGRLYGPEKNLYEMEKGLAPFKPMDPLTGEGSPVARSTFPTKFSEGRTPRLQTVPRTELSVITERSRSFDYGFVPPPECQIAGSGSSIDQSRRSSMFHKDVSAPKVHSSYKTQRESTFGQTSQHNRSNNYNQQRLRVSSSEARSGKGSIRSWEGRNTSFVYAPSSEQASRPDESTSSFDNTQANTTFPYTPIRSESYYKDQSRRYKTGKDTPESQRSYSYGFQNRHSGYTQQERDSSSYQNFYPYQDSEPHRYYDSLDVGNSYDTNSRYADYDSLEVENSLATSSESMYFDSLSVGQSYKSSSQRYHQKLPQRTRLNSTLPSIDSLSMNPSTYNKPSSSYLELRTISMESDTSNLRSGKVHKSISETMYKLKKKYDAEAAENAKKHVEKQALSRKGSISTKAPVKAIIKEEPIISELENQKVHNLTTFKTDDMFKMYIEKTIIRRPFPMLIQSGRTVCQRMDRFWYRFLENKKKSGQLYTMIKEAQKFVAERESFWKSEAKTKPNLGWISRHYLCCRYSIVRTKEPTIISDMLFLAQHSGSSEFLSMEQQYIRSVYLD